MIRQILEVGWPILVIAVIIGIMLIITKENGR